MIFYELHDARFVQDVSGASAAAGLTAYVGPVPAGKSWAILGASYAPSVAETRTVYFYITSRGGNIFPVTVPQSILLSGSLFFPALTMGMEITMTPGEKLFISRDAATAGSFMYLFAKIIEVDLPYYSYQEPLNKVVKQAQRHGSVYRSSGGISIGGGMPGGGHGGEGGGGGGGAEPY